MIELDKATLPELVDHLAGEILKNLLAGKFRDGVSEACKITLRWRQLQDELNIKKTRETNETKVVKEIQNRLQKILPETISFSYEDGKKGETLAIYRADAFHNLNDYIGGVYKENNSDCLYIRDKIEQVDWTLCPNVCTDLLMKIVVAEMN